MPMRERSGTNENHRKSAEKTREIDDESQSVLA